MLRMIPEIVGWLGLTTVGVAAVVGIVWAAFKAFSQRWLESHFAKELSAHEHDLNRRLEAVRSQFAALLDRSVKLHAKEFDTVPEAWRLLCSAMGSTGQLLQGLQRHQNVAHLSPGRLARVLDGHKFDEEDRALIESLQGRSRQDTYTRFVDVERFFHASEDQRHFHNHLVVSGIFIQPALLSQFEAVSEIIGEALVMYRIYKVESEGHENWTKLHEASKALEAAGPLQATIKSDINKRLWAVIEEPSA